MEVILIEPNKFREIIGEEFQDNFEKIYQLFKSKSIDEDRPLPRMQAAEYLNVSLSTLDNWAKKGDIKSHGIGSKVFYKMSDINSSLKKIN